MYMASGDANPRVITVSPRLKMNNTQYVKNAPHLPRQRYSKPGSIKFRNAAPNRNRRFSVVPIDITFPHEGQVGIDAAPSVYGNRSSHALQTKVVAPPKTTDAFGALLISSPVFSLTIFAADFAESAKVSSTTRDGTVTTALHFGQGKDLPDFASGAFRLTPQDSHTNLMSSIGPFLLLCLFGFFLFLPECLKLLFGDPIQSFSSPHCKRPSMSSGSLLPESLLLSSAINAMLNFVFGGHASEYRNGTLPLTIKYQKGTSTCVDISDTHGSLSQGTMFANLNSRKKFR